MQEGRVDGNGMIEDIDETAARWHFRQAADDMDWDGFTQWLEADPRHRAAYDAVALLDERIALARPLLARFAAENAPAPRRISPLVGWGSGAAAVAAAVALAFMQFPASSPVTPHLEEVAYRAPAGQVRNLQLADGLTAAVSPGSELRVASRDAPIVLDGSAFFNVRHDAAHPLVIKAGGYEIRDIGTRFEVMSGSGMLRVAVIEGRVSVKPDSSRNGVEVSAGQVLTFGPGGAPELRSGKGTGVASHRGRTLVYDQIPLGLVAADISRYGGQPIEVDPAFARRPFSGVIAPGDRAAMAATLAELTGLHARTDGDAIRLGDGAGR